MNILEFQNDKKERLEITRVKKHGYFPEWLAFLLDEDFRNVPFAILDTETTGLDGNARVHQIGVTTLLNGVTEEENCLNLYLNIFDDHSPADEDLVNMYDYSDLHDCSYFSDVVDEFENYIKGKILVAHNQAFDKRKIQHEYELIGRRLPPNLKSSYLDTRKVADLVIKDQLDGDRTLDSVAEVLGIEILDEEDRHQALPDAILTGKCMADLLQLKYGDRLTTVRELLTDLNMKYSMEKDG